MGSIAARSAESTPRWASLTVPPEPSSAAGSGPLPPPKNPAFFFLTAGQGLVSCVRTQGRGGAGVRV